MTNQEDVSKITPSSNYSAQIKQFENRLLEFMNQYGLPTDSVLVTVSERFKVFKNIEDVVEKIEYSQKQRSFYISKFGCISYLQKYFFPIYSLFPVPCSLFPKSNNFLALFKIEMHPKIHCRFSGRIV
ncbi:MAG: hypothetical protein F6K17_21770 [Okeania sp. SIO3C4]|nr:hypothetical protein [Okeania sp. SIO3B3]NER05034.1 hypothetical protein [Okeania sp. SIO3C4]